MGRIKNLGQEVETFPLVVVQDLDKKKQDEQRTIPGDLTGNVMSVARVIIHPILTETFTLQDYMTLVKGAY